MHSAAHRLPHSGLLDSSGASLASQQVNLTPTPFAAAVLATIAGFSAPATNYIRLPVSSETLSATSQHDTHASEKAVSTAKAAVAAIVTHLSREPLEDGAYHSAQAFLSEPSAKTALIARQISSLMDERKLSPAVRSDLIRLMAREPSVDLQSRTQLVREALRSSHTSIRDAGVQAVENWGDIPLLLLIARHQESSEWIRSYIAKVLKGAQL